MAQVKDLTELTLRDFPRSHWKKVRTTNAIERSFREVRRRTKPMSCFQNSASVNRIIYGIISHLNFLESTERVHLQSILIE